MLNLCLSHINVLLSDVCVIHLFVCAVACVNVVAELLAVACIYVLHILCDLVLCYACGCSAFVLRCVVLLCLSHWRRGTLRHIHRSHFCVKPC